jgi:hypothetical protein
MSSPQLWAAAENDPSRYTALTARLGKSAEPAG